MQVTNPLAGAMSVSSAQSIYQDNAVIEDGDATFNAAFLPNIVETVTSPQNFTGLRGRLATSNLPTLQWFLYLQPTYVRPSNGTTYTAQTDITWQPIIQLAAATQSVGTNAGLPFSSPAILPVGVPVRLSTRAAVASMGLMINVPAAGQTTFNSIHFILSVSQ